MLKHLLTEKLGCAKAQLHYFAYLRNNLILVGQVLLAGAFPSVSTLCLLTEQLDLVRQALLACVVSPICETT